MNYVAIKRIEKSQMDVVVNEVQLMHALSSPHTLKFYDWYETRCAGAPRAARRAPRAAHRRALTSPRTAGTTCG